MMFALGKLCIININKNEKESIFSIEKIKYNQTLLNLFNISKGAPVLYIPFKYNNIKSKWL